MKSAAASCDIIIPTYNNEGVLRETLTAVFTQATPSGWRYSLIVSDDGSHDGTVPILHEVKKNTPWPMKIITSSHRGSAAARNRALAGSDANVILLLGGDIILRPGALAAHLIFHTTHPAHHWGALGYINWDPRLHPSPFMEWMVHGGPQNDFDSLLDQPDVDARHYFYGSHLSIKRSFLGPARFHETFAAYGWEDLELGRRLADQGLKLKFLANARSLHRHTYHVADIVRRQQASGRGLHHYQKLHPNSSLLPTITWRSRLKLYLALYSGFLIALRCILGYSGKRWSTPRLFGLLTTVENWRGILRA